MNPMHSSEQNFSPFHPLVQQPFFHKSSLRGFTTTLPNLVLGRTGINVFWVWFGGSWWLGVFGTDSTGWVVVQGVWLRGTVSGIGTRWCLLRLMVPVGLSTTYERGVEWVETTVPWVLVSVIHTACPDVSWRRFLTQCLLLNTLLSSSLFLSLWV